MVQGKGRMEPVHTGTAGASAVGAGSWGKAWAVRLQQRTVSKEGSQWEDEPWRMGNRAAHNWLPRRKGRAVGRRETRSVGEGRAREGGSQD